MKVATALVFTASTAVAFVPATFGVRCMSGLSFVSIAVVFMVNVPGNGQGQNRVM
jgi:hypothetical protein